MASILACTLNISSARCWAEPGPADPKAILPGSALHSATTSFTLLLGALGWAISRFGVTPTSTMGVKSRSTL